MSLSNANKVSGLRAYAPGAVLVMVITASAYGLRYLPVVSSLSPMISAIFVGIVFANIVGVADSALAGVAVAGRRLLRIAVAALGLQLTFSQIGQLGVAGLVAAAFILSATFLFTVWAGRFLGVERGLSQLLAGGTAICGASAIAAINSVSRADDADVSYAIACITLFGTLAMFAYPALGILLGLAPNAYGIWVGFSVHEVAQVVGAGFQGGEVAGQTAVIAKLTRVLMLAPMVVALAVVVRRQFAASGASPGASAPPVPLFVVGLVALMACNSAGLVPAQISDAAIAATPIALTAALAALGLGTSFASLRARGWKPLLLAGLATLFIGTLSLLVVAFLP